MRWNKKLGNHHETQRSLDPRQSDNEDNLPDPSTHLNNKGSAHIF